MVSIRDLADDTVLRAFTDSGTLARGAQYAREDRVHSLEVAHNLAGLVIQGSVDGSGAATYQTVVSARRDPLGDIQLYAACTCPVGHACKHAVATLLAARELGDGGVAGGGTRPRARPAWERAMDDLLDDLDSGQVRAAGLQVTQLGLQFALPHVAPVASRFARWSGESARRRRGIRVRPVSMGTRGRWVKSQITWSDVPYADQHHRERYSQAHLDVLREMLVAQRAGSRHAYGYDSNADRDLHTFGPSLWRLLQQARDVGLPFVAVPPLVEVRASARTASLRLDVSRSTDGRALVSAGAELAGTWTDAPDLLLIGEPAHGVALWHTVEREDDAARAAPGTDPVVVTLAPIDKPPTPALLRLLHGEGPLEVPASGVDRLGEYLPRVQLVVPVTSRDGSVALPQPVAPRLTLTVTWVDDDEAALAWSWCYRNETTDREYAYGSPTFERGLRDAVAEADVTDRLVLGEEETDALCRVANGGLELVPQQRLRGMDAVGLSRAVLPRLRANELVDVRVVGEEPEFREAVDVPVVHFAAVDSDPDVEGRTDWLELEVVVSVEGSQIALATLLEALATRQSQILLHKGVYVSVDRPEFDALRRLLEEARAIQDQPRDGLRVGRGQTDLWAELAELGIVDEQAERWVRTARALAATDDLPVVAEPVSLRANLRPYQRTGFHWLTFLHDHGLGGILADDMGLGKTLQTLAMIARAREQAPGAAPFLVVAPTSVVGTWSAEAATFVPGLVVHAVSESHARRGHALQAVADGADVVVTSYTLFRIESDAYQALGWSGLVLDEAQAVKNHKGKTHQAVRRLDAPFKLAITGTPMENNLMELWSLLSITAPGLFPHPGRFAEHFANPIERGRDTDRLATLRRRIRPLMLRRTKDLVAADLPAKQEQVLEVQLTPRHRKIYDTHLQRERQKILGLIEDMEQNRVTIFASLTRLRQLSLDASLVDPAFETVESAKIEVLVEHLREVAAEGHRALVFSQFTGFLARVRARLDAEGIGYSYLDGRTQRRAQVIAGFKEGDHPAFLISLKAGGVGLTLTEADYCFLLDPWWNPAVEAQAVDRTHRIGQTRHVMVYRLVSVDTIEEKVMQLKERKQKLFTSVLEGEGAGSGRLSAADIRAMLA